MYSDSHPATIIEISKTGKTFTIQEDQFKMIVDPLWADDGFTLLKKPEYILARDPNGAKFLVRKTKRGWNCGRGRVVVGIREYIYDYTF